MNTFKIIAMPTEAASRVRSAMHDDFGNALSPLISDGSGPCRHCLRYADSGERLLLFSYKPFAKPGPYQEVGPVFVHADGCERFASEGGFPADFNQRPLVLRPYDAADNVQDSQVFAEAGGAERAARALLENPDVAYVHARSRTRGCYMFRIERAGERAT
ncbi:MAG TPA: DUF1203 domain-containing protein [Trinickia sp.]|nr:DUF1203 domain-containing protein [Trinickia sp.]